MNVHDVPTTVVTGFLGTGKTTAILSAFEHRPPGERWAVLVNEFGEVGIDGAILDGLAVKEIPGGCICCTAGVALRFGLVELLRTQKPDRLFIEPTGLANPASILDLLRQPGIRDAVSPRATITFIDPAHLGQPRYREHDAWNAQIALGDVLVGSFPSRRDPDEDAAFEAFTQELWPPPLLVTRSEGLIEPAWLDLDPSPRQVFTRPGHVPAEQAGWVFPRDHLWDADSLIDVLTALIRPNEAAPEGLLRLKGLFRVQGRWLLVQGTPTELRTTPALWRRDSRVDVIAAGSLDAEAVLRQLQSAQKFPVKMI